MFREDEQKPVAAAFTFQCKLQVRRIPPHPPFGQSAHEPPCCRGADFSPLHGRQGTAKRTKVRAPFAVQGARRAGNPGNSLHEPPRSTGCQPAVSPTGSRLGLEILVPADCQSATQQTASLRYGSWLRFTSNFWRCSLPMNLRQGARPLVRFTVARERSGD